MRMCILGGGGYLGQLLAQALQNEGGHFVVLFDLNFFASFPHIKLNEELTQRIEGSIERSDQLIEALTGCDACFHLAGYGMSGGPSLNKEKCFAINYWGTKNVIEICKNLGVSRLVFTSSVVVIFDGHTELYMADEDTPYLQSSQYGNYYAESKSAAEQLILAENCPPKFSTCALRLRGIYGPGELRCVQRFVDFLCKNVLVTFWKSEVPLTQFSSAENTVNALLLSEQSLRYQNSPAAGNKYHIVDAGPPVHSWGFWNPLATALNCSSNCIRAPYSIIYAFAFLSELMYRWFGIEPHLTRFECAIVGVTNTFSCQRAMRDFGYNPIRSHDLHSTIDFCLKQKEVQSKLKSRQQINENNNDDKKYPIDLTVSFNSIFSPINWIWVAWIVDSICSTKGLIILSKCAFLFLLLLIAGAGSVAHQTSTFVAAHRWWTFF
uniref:3-beta hydroxysteroid dehydrogenase/isomerase domain-containing protein n=1 Tax=Meloidogyne enterolobii TaxID=390850 RepID=A0A6V7VM62_MELEN|nr:unnamed protein product [Meloidogyne enterolobii]